MKFEGKSVWICATLAVLLFPYILARIFPGMLVPLLARTASTRFSPPKSLDLIPLPDEVLFVSIWDAGDHLVRGVHYQLPQLLACAFDEKSDAWTQFYCLRALFPQSADDSALRLRIKSQLWKLAKTRPDIGRPRLFIIQMLADSYFDSPDVQDFIISELEGASDLGTRDMYLNMLTDRSCQRAIPAVKRLMRSKERPIRKNLGYHFLGVLGNSVAFDALAELLPSEDENVPRTWLFMAMASTKDPRAKAYLVPLLNDRQKGNRSASIHYYWATLSAIARLGDPSTIPILEAELKKPNSPEDRRRIEKAIADIKSGGTPGKGIHTW